MMRSLALLVSLASVLCLTAAQEMPSAESLMGVSGSGDRGFRLKPRAKRTRRASDPPGEHDYIAAEGPGMRLWREEDYEAAMSVMSGGRLRGGRKLQSGNYDADGNLLPQYKTSSVAGWQRVALGISGTIFLLLAIWACMLNRELSSLNEYLPLGYKLFRDDSDTDGTEEEVVEEDKVPGEGIEMNQ